MAEVAFSDIEQAVTSDPELMDIVFDDFEKESTSANPFPALVPFGEYTLPTFPVHALPSVLGDLVAAEAEATQTPPDLPGILVLAVSAAALAKKIEIVVRRGWREPMNLFVAVVLPPANRKSTVAMNVIRPALEYEKAQALKMAPAIADAQNRKKVMESALTRLQAVAAKAKTEVEAEAGITEAGILAKKLAAFEVPASPRVIADDASQERLVGLMKEQNGRIAIISAEGGIFETMSGRYSNGVANLDVYLKGYSGDTIRVDRVNRASEFVEKPALTVALAVQPDVLHGLTERPGFRGKGLLGRFLYSLPESKVGFRNTNPDPVPDAIRAGYRQTIQALFALPLNFDEETGTVVPRLLRFEDAAARAFSDFETWLEPQLQPQAELGGLADWAGKLAGAVARIAGVLHMVERIHDSEPWTIPIGADSVLNAIDIAQYLIPHARAAFLEMGAEPEISNARHVLDWILKARQRVIKKQLIWQGTKGRFQRAKELDEALEVLVERGYVRETAPPVREGPGRKLTVYEVNPGAMI
ncbi:MAG: YfjI family protein [Eubacteriales bacterium]|nr:YfjI family protein [Eubacteriales bacterium]